MPTNWEDLLEFLRGGDYLRERYPAPEAPEFPSYQGLRPEEEKTILDSIKRYIEGSTQENLRSVGESAASRGFYRSGQLPKLEGDVRKAGTEAYSGALANYFTGKAGRMQSWNQQRAGFDMNRWQTLFGSHGRGMEGLGSTYGKFFRPRGQ